MWDLLHSTTAYYPIEPNEKDMTHMRTFFTSLPKISKYSAALKPWAEKFETFSSKNDIDLSNRENLCVWLCRVHNEFRKE